ncbi:cysteine-rich secretory protein 1 isoform X3 [Bos indicus]|uniref:Cysteine-rich secretory protein 1 isoform X3 n=1 Tax=Bos indicus TaxID=9915 RepID=A0ABM4RF58_BOSIN
MPVVKNPSKDSSASVHFTKLTGMTMKCFLFLAIAAGCLPVLIIKTKPAKVPYDTLLTELEAVQEEIVTAHNILRRGVSPPASNMLKMNWSEEAAQNARMLSKDCELVQSNALKRRITNTFCGENMHLTSYPISWSNVIRIWYSESKYFQYGEWTLTDDDVTTDHYTQVVWATSYLIGCGMSSCHKGIHYLYICHYCHEGNDPDKKNVPYNKGSPCGDCPNNCEDKLCNGFRKGRGARDQIANIHCIIKKAREFQKNIYIYFIDYAKAFDCVDHSKLWKILQEVGIPDHLTCLLRNLYAGQEATIRTGHETTNKLQTWKGVRQGCILSPCIFNLYSEYILQNARLDEAQAGIKIARRNINNLRYADDTTLMAESEEELKSLLMKVKEESEKVGLKLNIQKTKIKVSGPSTSWHIDGETMEIVTDFHFGLQDHCRW